MTYKHTSIQAYKHTSIQAIRIPVGARPGRGCHHKYIHTYIHTHIYTYIHTHIHTYLWVHVKAEDVVVVLGVVQLLVLLCVKHHTHTYEGGKDIDKGVNIYIDIYIYIICIYM
jgi:hypothetical protein